MNRISETRMGYFVCGVVAISLLAFLAMCCITYQNNRHKEILGCVGKSANGNEARACYHA